MLNTKRLKIGDHLKISATGEEIVIWSIKKENIFPEIVINDICPIHTLEGIPITEQFCLDLKLKAYTLKNTTKFRNENGWNLVLRKDNNTEYYLFEYANNFYKINYIHELNDYLDLLNL
jgi:hypothetical protein